jgi:hypothetical protein
VGAAQHSTRHTQSAAGGGAKREQRCSGVGVGGHGRWLVLLAATTASFSWCRSSCGCQHQHAADVRSPLRLRPTRSSGGAPHLCVVPGGGHHGLAIGDGVESLTHLLLILLLQRQRAAGQQTRSSAACKPLPGTHKGRHGG